MNTQELRRRILNGCKAVKDAEQRFTEIDSKFGDADHGLTMSKIAGAITEALQECGDNETIHGMMTKAADAVGELNGGSAVPLWNSWLAGMAEAAPDESSIDVSRLSEMFAAGLEEFDFMSGAEVGDKTIMDALKPATEAAGQADTEENLFAQAAEAAAQGAENTKNFTAKFGRAKSYGEKTLGTEDAGALSMAVFFKGMAE